jgi:hypothetical protein
MLTDMGAMAFAERARRELLATGATVHKRSVDPSDALTPQEVQIARLAADARAIPRSAASCSSAPERSSTT